VLLIKINSVNIDFVNLFNVILKYFLLGNISITN
jgi:hypothetical protein